MNRDTDRADFWRSTPIVILMAGIATFLWGSAFPCIKIGYRLFSIESGDTGGQMLFAGVRFAIAGLMVIAIACLLKRRFVYPALRDLPAVFLLSILQTSGHYFFFYVGMAHASGVSSSIINGSSTFFSILIAAWIFRTEKLSSRKIIGCLIGFAGVILIQLPGASLDTGFRLLGEGFILASALMSAFSSSYIKKLSLGGDPMVYCGYQFLLGGIVLALAGRIMGGRLVLAEAEGGRLAGILLLLYMAFISAMAYTLWSMLLKYNPVSRITVFGFMNSMFGVLLSAIFLHEANQAFSLYGLAALFLVSAGIILVNSAGKSADPFHRINTIER